MEQVKLYDVGNFSHKQFSGFYEIGETVYNCNNKRAPIRKYGKAPSLLLAFYPKWFTMEQAERDLTRLGFVKTNSIEWVKGD